MLRFPDIRVLSGAGLLVLIAATLGQGGPNAEGYPPISAKNRVLLSPVRIASLERGPLLVSDYGSSSICVVDRTTLSTHTCFPVDRGPVGVAWFRGHVLVGNAATGRVERYTMGGRLVGSLTEPATPNDLAVHEPSGKIFIVDATSRSIKILGPDGQLLQVIPGNGAAGTLLVNPVAIAVDNARGELLVSDYGDPALRYPAAIRIYDLSGNVLSTIQGKAGGFSRPQGLAVGQDRIYVADCMLGQVLVFDRSSGARIGSIGSFGDGPGQLMLPLDVLLDQDTGELFVTNNRLGRIERFSEGEGMP